MNKIKNSLFKFAIGSVIYSLLIMVYEITITVTKEPSSLIIIILFFVISAIITCTAPNCYKE
jgi:MFS superfamily sulfate permease-like transporter